MGVTEDYLPLGGARSVPSESLPRPLGPRAYTARRRGGSTPSLFFFSSRETHHPAPRRARRHSIPLLTHASLCCRLNPCRIQAGTTPGVSAASRAPAASAVAMGALLFCSASLNVAQFARAAAGADPSASALGQGYAPRVQPPLGNGNCAAGTVHACVQAGPGAAGLGMAPVPAAVTAGAAAADSAARWRRGCRRRGLVRGGGDGPGRNAQTAASGARGRRKDTWLLSCLFYKADINDELTDWRSVKAECDRERCATASTSTGPRTCGASPAAARRPGATRA